MNSKLGLFIAASIAGLLIVAFAIWRPFARTLPSPYPPGPPAAVPRPETDSKIPTVKETWSVHTGVSHWIPWHTPAVGSDGTIYVVGDHDLIALDPSGALKWRYPEPGKGFPPATVLIADDGSIWAGSSIGWTERISDAGTGSLQVGGMQITDHMALSKDGILLACGRALSIPVKTTGYPKDRVETLVNHLGPLRGAAFSSNAVITMDNEGGLESWGLDFQQMNWRQKVGYGCRNPALASDGTIYLGCSKGLLSISADGSEKWTFPTEKSVSPAVIAEDGSIVLGGEDGNVYRLEPDGSLRWKFQIGKATLQAPAISQSGVIYIGSVDGLYALNAAGTPLWIMKTRAPSGSPTIAPDGTVYIQSDDGMLHAIAQPENGRLAGQWPKLDADINNTARIQ